MLPLRLYLTASFLFFLVLKLLPSAVNETEVLEAAARPGATAAEVQQAAASAARSAHSTNPIIVLSNDQHCGSAGEPARNALQRFVRRVGERFRQDPRSFTEHTQAHMMGAAPYAIFLMLPAFAGIVMLAYRSRRMTYGEHFVFSLHLHAFWFLALLAIELLPKVLGDLIQLVVPVYGVFALHEVYRGRWGPTLARSLVISLLYGAVLLATTAGLIGSLLAAA